VKPAGTIMGIISHMKVGFHTSIACCELEVRLESVSLCILGQWWSFSWW